MPNTTHGYYVMGWLACLRHDPLADLFEEEGNADQG